MNATDQINTELLEACRMWIAYFQSDIPRNGDALEQQGEDFTAAWFATERAIANALKSLAQ